MRKRERSKKGEEEGEREGWEKEWFEGVWWKKKSRLSKWGKRWGVI